MMAKAASPQSGPYSKAASPPSRRSYGGARMAAPGLYGSARPAAAVRQGDEALSTEAPPPGAHEHIIHLPDERLRTLRVQLVERQHISTKCMERLLDTQSIKDHEVMTPITFYGPRGGREGLRELGNTLGPKRAARAIVEAEDANIMAPIARRSPPIRASAWREGLDLPA